jgi:ATP-dependent helicase/nuclease subunit B
LLELAPQLEAALSAGQTVVVPSAQRAAALRLAFATRQLNAGHRAFRTPDVQSLGGWLRAQPTRVGPDGRPLRRLGASEEWLLWRAAVSTAAAQLSLPSVPGLVDAVRRSAALLAQWCIAPGALLPAGTAEAALLHRSLTTLEARLAELSAAASWRALPDLATAPPSRVPLFAGFAFATPARRALLAAWGPRAAPEPSTAFAAAAAAMAPAVDRAAELQMTAQWCRQHLSAAPGARLLVIVPDLAQRHGEVRRVFDAALDPDYLGRGAAEADAVPYALEGGQPLLSYAPVGAGLRTLQLLSSDVELAQVSQWLRDGFWDRPAAGARAQLDVWLRTVVPPRLNAGQLLRALRVAPPALLGQADALAAVLARLLEAFAGGSAASLGVWSGRFAAVLRICGLHPSAARQRTSHTQQILQRLEELLQECAAVPAALGVFGAADAVGVFTQLLARTRFEPATGDAAVTLSASLADPILRYDGIWVSGLHSGAIPEHAHFDPLIPVPLQRQAGLIATDAAALVGQAQEALARLCHSSREFIVSAPAHDADLQLTASPLLAPYASRTYAAAPHSGSDLARTIRAARQIELYPHEPGLPWPEALPLPAGTRAIELQSRCPFRAYAQLRLGADPLEIPVPGITPRERGRLLHRALELLWQRLGGSQGLAVARAAQCLSPAVDACVAQAAGEILQGADPQATDDSYTPAADATGLLALRAAAITREQGRAGRLIHALCEVEATRAAFVIHELEAAHRLQVGAALINVRIDRVDRLTDGSYAILDYKSGRASTPDWEVARTTHPQLLVYLLAAGVPVSTLAVAHLDPKAVVFKGIADQDSRLPGLKGIAAANWAQQLEVWGEQVARLAADFVRGEAAVEPMDKACDYCHLQAFCRIAELQTPAEFDAGDESFE